MALGPKNPLTNIHGILQARWYQSMSFYLLETSMDSLVQVCYLVFDLLTPSLITQVSRHHIFPKSVVLKSLSQ